MNECCAQNRVRSFHVKMAVDENKAGVMTFDWTKFSGKKKNAYSVDITIKLAKKHWNGEKFGTPRKLSTLGLPQNKSWYCAPS